MALESAFLMQGPWLSLVMPVPSRLAPANPRTVARVRGRWDVQTESEQAEEEGLLHRSRELSYYSALGRKQFWGIVSNHFCVETKYMTDTHNLKDKSFILTHGSVGSMSPWLVSSKADETA